MKVSFSPRFLNPGREPDPKATAAPKALQRATVIGERTWAGPHPVAWYHLGGHLHAAIPESRSISPVTGTNREGTGIKPDTMASPADALAVAKALLGRRRDAGPVLRAEN